MALTESAVVNNCSSETTHAVCLLYQTRRLVNLSAFAKTTGFLVCQCCLSSVLLCKVVCILLKLQESSIWAFFVMHHVHRIRCWLNWNSCISLLLLKDIWAVTGKMQMCRYADVWSSKWKMWMLMWIKTCISPCNFHSFNQLGLLHF